MSFRGLVPPVRASSLVKCPFMPLARFLRDSRALLLPSSENVHGPLPARRQVRGETRPLPGSVLWRPPAQRRLLVSVASPPPVFPLMGCVSRVRSDGSFWP